MAFHETAYSTSPLHHDGINGHPSPDRPTRGGPSSMRKIQSPLEKKRKEFKDFIPPLLTASSPGSLVTDPATLVASGGFTAPLATNLKNHKPGSLFSPSLYCAICKIQSFSDADHLMHLNGKKHQLRLSKGLGSLTPTTSVCHNCQNFGHTRNECPQAVPTCHHCRELGHSARDCPKKVPVCHHCQESGHTIRNCPRASPVCFHCKLSHFTRDCPTKPPAVCRNCQESGHSSRQCPQRTNTCHLCHTQGHLARDCPQEKSVCHNCQETGHLARACTHMAPGFSSFSPSTQTFKRNNNYSTSPTGMGANFSSSPSSPSSSSSSLSSNASLSHSSLANDIFPDFISSFSNEKKVEHRSFSPSSSIASSPTQPHFASSLLSGSLSAPLPSVPTKPRTNSNPFAAPLSPFAASQGSFYSSLFSSSDSAAFKYQGSLFSAPDSP